MVGVGSPGVGPTMATAAVLSAVERVASTELGHLAVPGHHSALGFGPRSYPPKWATQEHQEAAESQAASACEVETREAAAVLRGVYPASTGARAVDCPSSSPVGELLVYHPIAGWFFLDGSAVSKFVWINGAERHRAAPRRRYLHVSFAA